MKQKDELELFLDELDQKLSIEENIAKEKLIQASNIIDDKYNFLLSKIKDNSEENHDFLKALKTLNIREKEFNSISKLLLDESKKIDDFDNLSKFEESFQDNDLITMNEQFNYVKTSQFRTEKQEKDFIEEKQKTLKIDENLQKILNIIKIMNVHTAVRIEKDNDEKNVISVYAFENHHLVNNLKCCFFSIKIQNGEYRIIKMNPSFDNEKYEKEFNKKEYNKDEEMYDNLGLLIAKIITNEYRNWVITADVI